MNTIVRIAIIGALGAGCTWHSPYMTETTTSARIEPSAGTAVVTFVRPSRFASNFVQTILDEDARFLGDAEAHSQFSVNVTPGHHVFVVWAENSDAVAADVVAGKHYFVEVSATEGWTSPRVHLIALTPRSKKWPYREAWLAETRTLVPSAAGNAYVERRKADALERVRRGVQHLGEYDAVDLEKRTIHADDGI